MSASSFVANGIPHLYVRIYIYIPIIFFCLCVYCIKNLYIEDRNARFRTLTFSLLGMLVAGVVWIHKLNRSAQGGRSVNGVSPRLDLK